MSQAFLGIGSCRSGKMGTKGLPLHADRLHSLFAMLAAYLTEMVAGLAATQPRRS